jgi:hypothetical protein
MSLDWDLAAAKIAMDQSSINRILALKNDATQIFFGGGGFEMWSTSHRIDPQAVDVAFGEVNYERLRDGDMSAALSELTSERAGVCRLECDISQATDFDEAWLTVERRSAENWSLQLSLILNDWENNSDCWLLAQRAMSLLNAKSGMYQSEMVEGITTAYSPVDGTFRRRNRSIVTYAVGNTSFCTEFFDDQLQIPKSLLFNFTDSTQDDIEEICGELFELFADKPKSIKVIDCPGSLDAESPLPPPPGPWSISAWASYRQGFDALVPPAGLSSSVRYPLWQKSSEDFERLLWQVDMVHTTQGSFFEIQTSEGREYLRTFLQEHQLEGEIWQRDFSQRWNLAIDPQSLSPVSDPQQNAAVLSGVDEGLLLSGLAQQQIHTAEAYASTLRERAQVPLDYSVGSLRLLDNYIAQFFPGGCSMESTLFGVAAYVGETIRRHVGGAWTMSDELPPGVSVNGLFANVQAWSRKRFDPEEHETFEQKFENFIKMLDERMVSPKRNGQ